MAATALKMSTIVVTLGIISFILGILAEIKKPSSGTQLQRNGVVICKYPTDPTVGLGYLSFGFMVASSIMGCIFVLYPYRGITVPCAALFNNTTFYVFFTLASISTGVAAAMTLWPTISEQRHLTHNQYHSTAEAGGCATAKSGLMGGAAFLSLNASLFWLASLMLVDNARQDFLHRLQHSPPPKP